MEKNSSEYASFRLLDAFTWRTNSKPTLRVLSQVAMFIALAFVLERLLPIVNLPTMRITLAFIPMMCVGMLFGPLWGLAAFAASDLLGWPIMGLPPILLIFLARVVTGFLYGLILHREDLKIWPHSIMNAFSTQIIGGMVLTTLGLSHLFGTPYLPLLLSRLPQFAILIALHIAVFPILVKFRYALRKTGLAHQ
ncbi:MAG: folate family ECF transporter S component [Oscillospiraceae bacterium]|nr:folate family ECF transporter S component [Oscillospiraceae bacterium]